VAALPTLRRRNTASITPDTARHWVPIALENCAAGTESRRLYRWRKVQLPLASVPLVAPLAAVDDEVDLWCAAGHADAVDCRRRSSASSMRAGAPGAALWPAYLPSLCSHSSRRGQRRRGDSRGHKPANTDCRCCRCRTHCRLPCNQGRDANQGKLREWKVGSDASVRVSMMDHGLSPFRSRCQGGARSLPRPSVSSSQGSVLSAVSLLVTEPP